MRECRSGCVMPRSGARYIRTGFFVDYLMVLASPHYYYRIHAISPHCNDRVSFDGHGVQAVLLKTELVLVIVPCISIIVE